jgi:phospholipase C
VRRPSTLPESTVTRRMAHALWALFASTTLALGTLGGARAQEARRRSSPAANAGIEHVVVIVLENATFDHMFGPYPGADGLNARRDQLRDRRGRELKPQLLAPADFGRDGVFPIDEGDEALTNGRRAAQRAFNSGRMDGFLRVQTRDHHPALSLRHHNRSTMPALWELADQGVLFDRYFSSFLGDSLPNLLNVISGDSQGVLRGDSVTLRRLWRSRFPTIFDSAQEAGVSWKYYVGDLQEVDQSKLLNGRYFREDNDTRPSQLYWAPVLSIGRFWHWSGLRSRIVPQHEFFRDAARGTLPAISYVLPVPNTHWPTSPEQSQRRILSLVNALKKSPDWQRSAAFLIWDDWGGFYDHVPPPRVQRHRLGFRLPALLLSPAAKSGYISHETHDHTSIPNFIAQTFGIDPVGHSYTSHSFADVWRKNPRGEATPVLNTIHRYRAAGSEYGKQVFTLYLMGIVFVVAVVGVLIAVRRRSAASAVVASVPAPARVRPSSPHGRAQFDLDGSVAATQPRRVEPPPSQASPASRQGSSQATETVSAVDEPSAQEVRRLGYADLYRRARGADRPGVRRSSEELPTGR